jgi:hypothetical protein
MNIGKPRQVRSRHLSITIKEEVMNRTMNLHVIVLSAVMGMFLLMSGIGHADSKSVSHGHKQVTGVVTTEKGGILTVKTPTGDYSLTENASRRHGHAVPKVGDEVTLVLDENNAVIEAHPKGEEGTHQFYTGKLVYMGKMNKEIKLQTADGEKVFPLGRLEIKTKPIEEGTMVTVEVNEGGTVIDLHRASHDEKGINAKGKTHE